MLSVTQQKEREARDNRYGLHGTNEFDEVVAKQCLKEGIPAKYTKSVSDDGNIMDISRRSGSPSKSDKLDESYDYQPVRGERRVVNQEQKDPKRLNSVPGVMSVQ